MPCKGVQFIASSTKKGVIGDNNNSAAPRLFVFVRAVSIKPQELAVPLPFSESFEVIFGKGGQRSLAFSFGILLFST